MIEPLSSIIGARIVERYVFSIYLLNKRYKVSRGVGRKLKNGSVAADCVHFTHLQLRTIRACNSTALQQIRVRL